MAGRWVYLSGEFIPESEARISIYDSALTMGDMAFEVTRTCRQRPYRLNEHLERLFHSLRVLRIDPGLSIGELARITEETLARNLPTQPADVDWNIIHNVSRGPAGAFLEAFSPEQCRPTVVVSCFPLEPKMAALATAYCRGIDLVVPAQRAVPSWLCDTTIKTRSRASYQLANFQAQDHLAGAWAVLVDPDGFLTEGTSGNVFLVRDRVLETPHSRNVLLGVTRGVILRLAQRLGIAHQEHDLTPADAATASEMFVSSTSIGILPVRSFQGSRLGEDLPGPVTARLQAALWEELGLNLAQQAEQYARRLG